MVQEDISPHLFSAPVLIDPRIPSRPSLDAPTKQAILAFFQTKTAEQVHTAIQALGPNLSLESPPPLSTSSKQRVVPTATSVVAIKVTACGFRFAHFEKDDRYFEENHFKSHRETIFSASPNLLEIRLAQERGRA